MIKINIKENNNKISNITILGHSGYDEIGKDIVCASVSSIVTTTINSIVRIDNNIKYKYDCGNVVIDYIDHSKTTDILIDNMIDLLEQLEKQYSKYIKINKEVLPC